MMHSFFVSCPRGLEYLLADEISALGIDVQHTNHQGVYGEASLKNLYRMCLWSRLANRVQLILFKGQAETPAMAQQLCKQYPWKTVFDEDKSISVEFHGSSLQFRNAMFGAQVVKDGIVDYFREHTQQRPDVDKRNPDILLHAFLKKDTLTLSLDLCGYSLHQRGYRLQSGDAPLKENMAAALLLRARWPELANNGYALLDPCCGSGTLVIEAAMMAANIAPGLLRNDQALIHWNLHQAPLWEETRALALQEKRDLHNELYGNDDNEALVRIAKANALRAGLGSLMRFAACPIQSMSAPASKGLLICNPPYGERMGELQQLIPLYQSIGQRLQQHFQGWQAGVLTNNPMLAKALGLRSNKQYSIFNGAIACKLYCFEIKEGNQYRSATEKPNAAVTALHNRLQKNWQHLQKWAKRIGVTAYRVYDADLPDYAFALDWYDGTVVLQEYAPPASIPPHKAEKRSLEMLQAVPAVFSISEEDLILKERKQQKGREQYQRLSKKHREKVIQEGGARLKVNLSDYLDTGLFLDHRPLRLQFSKLPAGSRFLNCFCYTATASVHAALGGALSTNVDLSNTYLRWAQDNFELNGIDPSRHQFIQFDCIEWLGLCQEKYDTIFLDPPTFSNSKRMRSTLDVQRDHEALIRSAMRLLAKDGRLYFSTNLRSFKLSPILHQQMNVKDISKITIDEDFKRKPKIHYCFELSSPS